MEGGFWIDRWLVQPQLNTILSPDNTATQLEPKVLEVLVYLADHAGEVVSKESLLHALWGDTFVTENALTRCIAELRKTFNDDADEPRFIRTITKKGYRLIAQVSRLRAPASRYEILEKLSRGAMGEVFLAKDTELDRKVVLKFVLEQKGQDETARKRLLREARAAAVLDHPFACRIYDTGQINGKTFIAMEFLEGQTLKERLARGRLEIKEALRIGSEIAEALASAHDKGIVHSDLKPSNVMISPQGHVKVMDFGLAKLLPQEDKTASLEENVSALTREGTTAGALPYMSPEQAEGRPMDVRSDIFSFGSLLYETVTGRRAFEGESALSMLSAILNQEPKPMEGVPPELQRVIGQCLCKDAARRFQHMDDVKVALEELKEESDSGKLFAEVPAETKRRRWLLPVALGAGVALLVGAFWVWRIPRSKPAGQGPVLTRLTSDSGLTTEPALSPDGKLLVYASDRSGEGNLDLWLQQIPGGQPVRLTHEKADAHEPSFSVDGTKIAYRSELDGGGIYVMPALGGDARKIAGNGHNPRFSPDGTLIVYWTGRVPVIYPDASAYVVPVVGGTPELLAPDFRLSFYAGWFPDGKWILFSGVPKDSYPEGGDLWVVPASGGAPIKTGFIDALRKAKLAIPGPYHRPGEWLGDRRLFSARLGDSTNLWEISLSLRTWKVKGEPRRLTFGAGEDYYPCLAGGHLVFASTTTNVDIWSLPLDSNEGKVLGGIERLTRDAASDFYPSVSTDGRKTTFFSSRSGSYESWIKDLETGKETALTSHAKGLLRSRAFLRPDGTKAYYRIGESIHILDLAKHTDKELVW